MDAIYKGMDAMSPILIIVLAVIILPDMDAQ
jgi:hypothetical protein